MFKKIKEVKHVMELKRDAYLHLWKLCPREDEKEILLAKAREACTLGDFVNFCSFKRSGSLKYFEEKFKTMLSWDSY